MFYYILHNIGSLGSQNVSEKEAEYKYFLQVSGAPSVDAGTHILTRRTEQLLSDCYISGTRKIMTARLPYAHTRISLLLFYAQWSAMYMYRIFVVIFE
jgi:hypothetical protein